MTQRRIRAGHKCARSSSGEFGELVVAGIRLYSTGPGKGSAAGGTLCRYLDLPLQHVADNMLSAMGRGIDGARVRKVVETLFDRVPGIALRTTLMVGFPGETDGDFAELVRFVDSYEFEQVGVLAGDEKDERDDRGVLYRG